MNASIEAVQDIPGMLWPAVPSPQNAILSALVKDFELNATRSPGELLRRQRRQVSALLRHAYETCPFYTERLGAAGYRLGDDNASSSWKKTSPLTRAELQKQAARLTSNAIPIKHGRTFEESTSGSTGFPVTVLRTAMTALMTEALTVYEHLLHNRDLSGKHAFLKFFEDPEFASGADGVRQATWGPPLNRLYESGPSIAMSVETSVTQQADFLLREEPQYVLSYPSNLAALALHFRERSLRLKGLVELRTLGETLSPAVRELCNDVFGVRIVDMYSCTELGYMAMQCPDGDHYHATMEGALVEVLDDDDRPCEVGQAGRVVVTALSNFSMPLIRYDIGDRAVQGTHGGCGRPQPVIETVLGRSRDMLQLPSGRRVWPRLRLHLFAPESGAAIEQVQVVQKSLSLIQVRLRLATATTLEPYQEEVLRELVQDALQHPFDIEFALVPEIPKGARGKFHDFLCEIA